MRLFVALEVMDAWRAAASEQQAALAAAVPLETRRMLRVVRPDLMHLTLRFMGEVDEGGVAPLQAALDGLAPFAVTIALDRAGTFGPAARTGVVWLGIGGEVRALRGVAESVERAIRLVGARPEDRPFTAHLTLARLARHATEQDRRAVAEAVHALDAPPPLPFATSELALVRSILEGPSPRYEVLSHHS